MKPLSEVLTEAARLLGQGWTGPISRDEGGLLCDPFSPRCAAWDLYGALFRAAENNPDAICDALNLLDGVAPGGSALLWEERPGRHQNDVVGLVKRAAQRAWRAERSAA